MAHRTSRNGYENLVERLNEFPQGATPSDTLYQILKMLFSEKEAELVSKLPIRPFTIKRAQKAWDLNQKEAREILDELASRAILLDVEKDGEHVYILPPPMAGFFEFSMMRLRGDIDQKVLADLFYQYMNQEEDFIKDLFTEGETQLGRVFVNESVLTNDHALYVLDYERASEVIKNASHIGVGLCYCRHKMEHKGQACDAPMDICMTFNNVAESLIKNDYAREVDAAECLELLDKAREHNLVQFGENVQNEVSFICNCCSCCCEAMIAAQKFGMLEPIHTTNFLPEINETNCVGCEECIEVCAVDALTLEDDVAHLNEDICLGCGNCKQVCPANSISLKRREERVITPVDSVHKTVMMAIERGQLQNLIFDNQALKSHRIMAAILGAIIKLPPLKQILAQEQIKSKYLGNLINKFN
ncbi:4Fe-4S binding protein [Halanaerobiaceae bacterium Z-7014]|uniref:Ferredoxin n=1 Tax=Halonatronomonas betaini TaxID=2778430 RepID=A0A931AU84_9FIRM|nr:4Fe-4S binding protein [Halonatronomonas betaini]MBF8436890.1 4Fe-4S binding protein [Halonatronomonas betaini]